MFRNKVALIVGAGASHELGFPLGSELKTKLQSVLDIKFKHGSEQFSGDYQIVEALRHFAQQNDFRDINPYLHAGWAIRDAMPTTGSIDSFLQTHSKNDKIVLMGKLGIARAILTAEQKSPLCPKDGFQDFDLGFTEKTWYAELFKLLAGDVQDPAAIFNNLDVICFNYDRSLEHYLVWALVKRFLIARLAAEEIVKSLRMHHPYGVVGRLPWQDNGAGIPYGGNDHFSDLSTAISELRTFSEGVEDGHIAEIRKILAEADTILIVGFGFANINMDLLQVGGRLKEKRVYVTAFDIDSREISVLQNRLAATLNTRVHLCMCYEGCSSVGLFQICRMSFSDL